MPLTASPHDHRLLVVASLTGMAAVLTLPMSAVAPGVLRPLVFALPLTLAIVARMRRLRWLLAVAVGLLVLVALALGPIPDVLAVVPTAIVLVGPVVAVVAVGAPLREVDLIAAGGFLLSGTIAVIAGFASRGIPGAAVGIALVGTVGVGIVAARLLRAPASA